MTKLAASKEKVKEAAKFENVDPCFFSGAC